MSYLLERITQDTLSPSARRLLELSLGDSPSQQKLDAFLKEWDLDTAPMTEAVLLSYLKKMHSEFSFPANISPRLSGLLSYCRYKYLDLVSHFGTFTHALQAQGIEFLVMKGGAMKALRPDFPRWMGDIDILVREKDYKKAEGVAKACGFNISHSMQSMDLSLDGKAMMDVHRYVLIFTGRERAINDALFERSTPARIFSVDARMPSREDLLFLTMVNLVRNLADSSSPDSVIYSFFDARYLTDVEDFDWSIVRKNAALTGSEAHVALASRFFNGIIPGLIPEGELNYPGEKKYTKTLKWVGYRRYKLIPEREKIGEFNVIKALKGGAPFFQYIIRRLRYAVHKRLQFLR